MSLLQVGVTSLSFYIRLILQWDYEPLVQNHPDDEHIYLLSLTLNKKSFSTFDANVFCVIYGEKGKTDSLHLFTGTKRKVGSFTSNEIYCAHEHSTNIMSF